jgi:signal transduction histidine kinase
MFSLLVAIILMMQPDIGVRPDSVSFESYMAKSRQYYISTPDSNRIYADSMVVLGQKVQNDFYVAQGLKWKGIYHHVAGHPDEALDFYQQSAEMFEVLRDTVNWIESVLSVSLIQINQSKYDTALENLFQALDLSQTIGNIRLESRTYSEIAKIFSLRGDHAAALPYFELFLNISLQRENRPDIAMAYGYLGTVNSYLGNTQAAIENLEEAARRHVELNDFRALGRTYQTLGNIQKKTGNLERAATYYQRSITEFERLNDIQGLGIAYYNLGVLYFDQKSYSLASRYLNLGIENSTRVGHTDLIILGYQKLSETYAASSQFRLAYEAFSRYFAYNDSVNNRDRQRAIAELQTRFETREKEQLIELQRLQLSEQDLIIQRNRFLQTGLAITLLLLIVGWLLWQSKVQQRELRLRVGRLELEQRMQLERERISRDLHDHVGAQLVNMLSGIDLAGRYSGAGNPAESSRIMDSLKDEARTTIRQLRDTIWTLNATEITPDAFFSKLEAYIKQVINVTELHITLINHLHSSTEFSPSQALNIFRIIQEALQNIVKYAGATQVTITFSTEADALKIAVSDNGRFLHRTEDDPHIGSGVKNMQKRASEIGGTLHVIPSEDGTTVELNLPETANILVQVTPAIPE